MTLAVEQRPAPVAPARRIDPRVPTLLLVIAAVVIAANLAVLFLGAWSIGVTIDEPYHVSRLQNWFQSGWYLPGNLLIDGQPDPSRTGLFVYAPVSALLAHGVSILLGSESPGSVVDTAHAYATRHMFVALMCVVGLVAVAATARLLLRSWRWGVVCAAVLSAIPTWLGHGMFNIKDIPVATGYSLITLGAVALCRPHVVTARRLQVLGVAALALGTIIALGTRPGLWVALAATLAGAFALSWWVESRSVDRATALPRLLARLSAAAVGVIGAWMVLVLVYPAVFSSPARLVDAFHDSADFPWGDQILTNGTFMTMPPPPSYLPLWFGAQTPIVVLALAVVGILSPLVLLRPGRGSRASADLTLGTGQAIVNAQALMLPAGAILTGSVLYDGTRQVLFVLPALAVSATVATYLLARRAGGRGRGVLRIGLFVALALGLAVPTVTAAQLFPYSYTWFNAAAAAKPIDGNWMTDYWSASDREITPQLPASDLEACYDWKPQFGLISCSLINELRPYWATRGSKVALPPLQPGQYDLMVFNRSSFRPPPGCTLTGDVTRPLFLQRVTMSYTARCSVPMKGYPSGGISADGDAGLGYLLWGWNRTPEPGWRWAYQTSAEVGFTLPADLQGRDLDLAIDAAPYFSADDTASSLEVLVNGTSVGRYSFVDGDLRTLDAKVPASVLASLPDGRVVVKIVAPRVADVGDPEGSLSARYRSFRMSSLTVAPATP